MLTLTRKLGEEIVVELEDGRTITILVKEIRRNQVRLGVAAPRAISIYRGEIYEDIVFEAGEDPHDIDPYW